MTNIQRTMENFNKNNSTLDLRPEGHEAAAVAAQAKKEELLAKQAATSSTVPKGMDIKPAAPSKGFNQVPGINSEPAGEANVFKLNQKELENPPAQVTQPEAAPQIQQAQTDLPPVDAQPSSEQPDANATQPSKKAGFFSRLFGKK